MNEYIKKHKWLFMLAIGIAIELISIYCFLAFWSVAHNSFQWLKINPSIQKNMHRVQWSFWDFLLKSGISMNTYGNITRLMNYNINNIASSISDFFSGQKIETVSMNNNEWLIENFRQFNLSLQLSVLSLYSIAIFAILNVFLIITNLWKIFISAKKENFYRLIIIFALNIIGFWLLYEWEERNPHLSNTEEIEWISKSKLFKKLKKIRVKKYEFKETDNLIEVKNLWAYDRKQRNYCILKEIDLSIKKGSFNVIIGPNGAGKTTLIKCLLNIKEEIRGRIIWHGNSIRNINPTEFARYVSYIPQILNIQNSISVFDFLQFSRYPYRQLEKNSRKKDEKIILEALEANGCESLIEKNIEELSGGQRQKIILTSILVQESEIVVIDEPTSFLDLKNQHLFLESLKEMNKKGKTIIMILHNIQQSINYASNLIVMKEGTVKATGEPKKIVNKKLLKEIFSIDCEIKHVNETIQIENIHEYQ